MPRDARERPPDRGVPRAERRERARAVAQNAFKVFADGIDLVPHDLIALRNGLRRGRLLNRVLRHRHFDDRCQRRTARAVEDVEIAGLGYGRDGFASHAVEVGVEQDRGIGRVEIPDVVAHELEVPAVLAGAYVERDQRDGKQIVAATNRAIQIRRGVARREVEHAELGVDARRLPHGRAAVLPSFVVLRPRCVADLAGTRHGVEIPHAFAALRVVSADATAHGVLAAREANDDLAVVVERRGRDAFADAGIAARDVPHDLARDLIERDEPGVEPADENLAVTEADAAA